MKYAPFLFMLLCISCTGIKRAKKLDQDIVRDYHQLRLKDSPDSISINYTGCGGFLIMDNNSAILMDPYFSNLSATGVLFKKLESDTVLIDQFFGRVIGDTIDAEGIIKAILVAHSHYDHLADVPSVFLRNCNQDSTQIIGSKTTQHLLRGAGINSVAIPTAPGGKQDDRIIPLLWHKDIYTKNGRIKIQPIPSEHAPHICGIKILSAKKLSEDLAEFPEKARKLPEGQNYNFLIDFLDEQGQITFRIFSHAGAACDARVGFPPAELLDERRVDVLLLCVASFGQVKGYPEELVNYIRPRHIILNHWENFFRPIEKLREKPATVPLTNVKKFISRLEQSMVPMPKFTLPQPGTEIVIYY